MKIAILVTGQPRYLEQGAWWIKNRVFPESGKIKADYYCYFWNDSSENLNERIQHAYSPVRFHTQDFETAVSKVIDTVQTYNKKNPRYLELAPRGFRENVMFDTKEITSYGKNFWGQFIAADTMTKMLGNFQGQYDLVIKTRSDAIINNMDEKHWLAAFENIHANPIFHDKILSSWMYVDSGIPHIGDFCFIAKPETWYNYSKNLKENCIKVVTQDKAICYELNLSGYKFPSHWMWLKASYYSKTNWLSFATTWPTPFDITLLRENVDIQNTTFQKIQQNFHREDQEKHQVGWSI